MLTASARILYKGSQAGDLYVGETLKKADSAEIEKNTKVRSSLESLLWF